MLEERNPLNTALTSPNTTETRSLEGSIGATKRNSEVSYRK